MANCLPQNIGECVFNQVCNPLCGNGVDPSVGACDVDPVCIPGCNSFLDFEVCSDDSQCNLFCGDGENANVGLCGEDPDCANLGVSGGEIAIIIAVICGVCIFCLCFCAAIFFLCLGGFKNMKKTNNISPTQAYGEEEKDMAKEDLL